MFVTDEAIDITASVGFTVATLKANKIRRAVVTAPSGGFRFRFGGGAPTASTWHFCPETQAISVQEHDLAGFRMIAVSGSGTAYVSYFDKPDGALG